MLEVKDLKKSFGDNKVLNGIDVKIKKGERIAIIGPSGCGKSTFLRCLNFLEVPDSGDIIFDGINICEKDVDLSLIRRKMGMVFQQFNLFPHMTVLDNITMALVKLGIMSKEKANKKALELLESINLKYKANNYPDELSGGQKQRVAIIRTLIMDPEVVLFDEPTSALDPEMVFEVLDLIMEVAKKNITMIMVSHEMGFVKKFATKILFLDEGKVSFYGTVEEAFNNKDNKRLNDFLHITKK
jgi:polar amino acid transport system ATP-binding protein